MNALFTSAHCEHKPDSLMNIISKKEKNHLMQKNTKINHCFIQTNQHQHKKYFEEDNFLAERNNTEHTQLNICTFYKGVSA